MVNFSDKILANRVAEWSQYYLDYALLKKIISDIARRLRGRDEEDAQKELSRFSLHPTYGTLEDEEEHDYPDPDEEFFKGLEKESFKVQGFYEEKLRELTKRLTHVRDSVRRLREKYQDATTPGSPVQRKKSGVDSHSPEAKVKKAFRNEDHSDSGDDAGEESEKVGKRDMHASASLKRSFVDIYRQMNYLQNFATMNYTACVKIIKKHDKVTKLNSKKRAMQIVSQCSFSDADDVTKLMTELENLFAAVFHNGNLRIAKSDLLAKNRPMDNLEMLHIGFRFGVVATLMVWVLWVMGIDAVNKPADAQMSASVFIVYRGISTLVLAVWLWAFNLYVWESARVNYIFLFEFDPRVTTTPFSVARRASSLTTVLLVNMLFFVKISRGELFNVPPSVAAFLPLGLFVYMWCIAIYTRLGGAAGPALAKVIVAPFSEVTFFQSFVADILTSMVRPIVDITFSFCFFFSGEWHQENALQVKDATQSICMNSWFYQNLIVPFVISLPLWWRFAQCLRRYYDTGKRIPNLLNATKYAIAYSVVLLGAVHATAGDDAYFHQVWFTSALVSSLVTFFWDVFMDWGLFKSRSPRLREALLYPTWAYYVAIVLDLNLRFLWTCTLFPSVAAFFAGGMTPGMANSDYSTLSMYLTALISWLEACRRSMWACFRVEHEHVENAFGFRRVDFVPLHFDSPLDHEGEDVKKKMTPISKFGFFVELFVFFSWLAAVAAFTIHYQLSSLQKEGV